jgi:hypothetical protein
VKQCSRAVRGEKPPARIDRRAVATEVGITAVLGIALSASSLGLLVLQYPGKVHLGAGDLIAAGAAGLVAAAVIRLTVRLHRHWKRTLGRITAAAALCAVAAMVGALAVTVPDHCPGVMLDTGRCGVREASSWGEVAGLAAVVNFGLAGVFVALYRGFRGVLDDASEQSHDGLRALGRLLHRRLRGRSGRAPTGPRHSQESKGRPTPRRADTRRERRERLRDRA